MGRAFPGYIVTQSIGPLTVVYAWPVDRGLPAPLDGHSLINSSQAHTCTVLDLDHPKDVKRVNQVFWDGAVWSAANGPSVMIQTADCMPLVVCDEAKRWVGVVHLSWRNLSRGMLEVFLQTFLAKVKSPCEHFCLGMGPHLCGHHLWLGPSEVRAWCEREPELRPFIVSEGGRTSVCWEAWVMKQAQKVLGPLSRSEVWPDCTLQTPLMPSFRRRGQARPSLATVVSATQDWTEIFKKAGWQSYAGGSRPMQMNCVLLRSRESE